MLSVKIWHGPSTGPRVKVKGDLSCENPGTLARFVRGAQGVKSRVLLQRNCNFYMILKLNYDRDHAVKSAHPTSKL